MADKTWQDKRTASGPLILAEPDFMAVWLDSDNYIQFVNNLLTDRDLPAPIMQDIRTGIGQIQRRQNDPNLYVAIVGEFNSGKSTFINALLRQELLKQSAVVRTAAPTKICYGLTPDIKVSFTGESKPLSYREDTTKFVQKLRVLNPRLTFFVNDTLRDYLHVVTTDPLIAAAVEEVMVYQPANFLSQNIVIIDTPGANARDPRHIEITRRIIEQDADAVVITIPATATLSGKLADFMENDLAPFLHRCLPIVTRLDQLDTDDQQMVINDLRERLPEITGSQELAIYEAAPQIVIDMLYPKRSVSPHLQQWNTRFAELEKVIWDRLCYERTTNVSESLLRGCM